MFDSLTQHSGICKTTGTENREVVGFQGLRCGEVLIIKGHMRIWRCDGTVLYLDDGGDYMPIYLLKFNQCTIQGRSLQYSLNYT